MAQGLPYAYCRRMASSKPHRRSDPDEHASDRVSRGDAAAAAADRAATAVNVDSPFRISLRVFLACLAVLLALAAVFSFRYIVLGALVGVMIGVLPEPLTRWLRDRFGVPRAVGAVGVGLLAAIAFGALAYGVYVTLVPEIERLLQQGPAIAERLNAYKQEVFERLSSLGVNLEQLDFAAMAQGGARLLMTGLSIGIDGLAAAVVVVMIALFVMSNYEGYVRGVRSVFPPRARPRVTELGTGSARVLRRWFVGQLGVVTVSGVLTAVAMLLIGVDYWLLIAALTMVLDFVPFIGAVITGAVALLLTFGTEPDKALWVLLAFIGIQQIESNLVLPMVLKGTIRLPEAHLLVFVVVMGSAFGILGIFIAPPCFAVLHYLYTEAYVPWLERRARPG